MSFSKTFTIEARVTRIERITVAANSREEAARRFKEGAWHCVQRDEDRCLSWIAEKLIDWEGTPLVMNANAINESKLDMTALQHDKGHRGSARRKGQEAAMKILLKRFLVPSSSTSRRYVVSAIEGTGHGGIGTVLIAVACTCPDFENRIHSCKHMRGVEANSGAFEEVK